jgi:hypothetical protein
MSEGGNEATFIRRVRGFAWALLIFGIVSAIFLTANTVFQSWYEFEAMPRWRIFVNIASYLRRAIDEPLYIVGMAVIALLAAQIATSGNRSWLPALDARFRKAAGIFAGIILIFAAVSAVWGLVSAARYFPMAIDQIRVGFNQSSAPEFRRSLEAILRSLTFANALLVVPIRFLTLVLGAYVIRLLLAVSPTEEAVATPSEESANE